MVAVPALKQGTLLTAYAQICHYEHTLSVVQQEHEESFSPEPKLVAPSLLASSSPPPPLTPIPNARVYQAIVAVRVDSSRGIVATLGSHGLPAGSNPRDVDYIPSGSEAQSSFVMALDLEQGNGVISLKWSHGTVWNTLQRFATVRWQSSVRGIRFGGNTSSSCLCRGYCWRRRWATISTVVGFMHRL